MRAHWLGTLQFSACCRPCYDRLFYMYLETPIRVQEENWLHFRSRRLQMHNDKYNPIATLWNSLWLPLRLYRHRIWSILQHTASITGSASISGHSYRVVPGNIHRTVSYDLHDHLWADRYLLQLLGQSYDPNWNHPWSVDIESSDSFVRWEESQ